MKIKCNICRSEQVKVTGRQVFCLNCGSEGFLNFLWGSFTVVDGDTEKPPLGLKPRKIHDEERASEVRAAIRRYVEGCKPVPEEWLREYSELMGVMI